MRRYLIVAAATAAAVTLTGLTPAGGALAGAPAPGTRAAPGARLWVARFPGSVGNISSAMAVSPRGSRVFVTGASYGGRATGVDYKAVGYGTATGRQLWASWYSGPGHYADLPTAVAVSPDGRAVFVTGYARGWGTGYDYATVAYSAATGRQLWASRYTGPGNRADRAVSVAVSPGGATVFVTGTSDGRTTGADYATAAYSAATGRQLWASRYNGPGNGDDGASSMAVSPGGATVFVTGTSDGRTTGVDYATVAYSAATGRQLWASRYNGHAFGYEAVSAAVSPGGATVFVTGGSQGPADEHYATVAYQAATGRQLWASRYSGPGGLDVASAVAVSPGGATVYVTGGSAGGPSGNSYATVAYRAATGKQLWVSRYNGPKTAYFNGAAASAVAVSPGGATVYVTGTSYGGAATGDDYATVAYRASTGKQLWARRYNSPESGDDDADSIAVSPDGTTVSVTGWAAVGYATVAYRG